MFQFMIDHSVDYAAGYHKFLAINAKNLIDFEIK